MMKQKYFTIGFALITLIACNNTETKKALSSDNEKIIYTYYEHFNNHDWTKMANMYADTSEFKDPSLGPGIVKQTRQQIITKYAELQKTFPDVHDEIIKIYTSGSNHLIVEFVSTGTAPDSSKFKLPICTIFTIENGLITKDYTYYDNF